MSDIIFKAVDDIFDVRTSGVFEIDGSGLALPGGQ